MNIEDLRARLTPVPNRLPATPRELVPVALGASDEEVPRLPPFEDTPRREAAVLILFYAEANDEAHLVLTERSPGGHRHAGQISLPGGAIDDEDESIPAAALREASEEVGLDTDQAGVLIHGILPVVDVRVSGFMVHPVICFAERPPELTPDGYEVAEVFSAPVATFLPTAPIEIVTAERDGFRLRYGAYRVGRHLVWGATAMMLGRLGAFLGQTPGRGAAGSGVVTDRGA